MLDVLTHWGRVTHICVGKLTIIGSDNGLSPGRRQAIIWTNAGILLIGPLATNFSEILIRIQKFSFKKMLLKMSSVKWRPFCLGLNVLMLMSAKSLIHYIPRNRHMIHTLCFVVVSPIASGEIVKDMGKIKSNKLLFFLFYPYPTWFLAMGPFFLVKHP